MKVREGTAPFGDWATWYRVTGGDDPAQAPLVVLHGGPGATHAYVESFADRAQSGRMVIHYVQIGCGRSSRLPDRGAEFFNVALFLSELRNLFNHLDISERFHLLGQSWGGMLAAEFAVTRPAGVSPEARGPGSRRWRVLGRPGQAASRSAAGPPPRTCRTARADAA